MTLRWLKESLLLITIIFFALEAYSVQVRIKDIVSVEGIRKNHLVGYGLVVGLKGTGDDVKNSPYSKETIVSMLERLGVNIRDKANQMKSKNIAAVMVTAHLPAFARHGSQIDVTVSAIGDARDLLGGTLLVTPLRGADDEVYAVAQGPVATSAFDAKGAAGSSLSKGVPTSGKITNGAIIEKEIDFEFKNINSLNLALHNPDFTTAKRIADRINKQSKAPVASALDPSTVKLTLPVEYRHKPMEYITQIEQLTVVPDQIAKIIIDEQNGVIVMGEHVRISTVAISHGNLTIRITETPLVSQPNPFPNLGTTEIVQRSRIEVDEDADRKLMVMEAGVTLQELVKGLNSLGVSPRDMITILQNIKAAGALQAELEVK